MHLHECDSCGLTADAETIVPPPGWVRRGGRRTGEAGRWLLVLCEECDDRAGAKTAGADGRTI